MAVEQTSLACYIYRPPCSLGEVFFFRTPRLFRPEHHRWELMR